MICKNGEYTMITYVSSISIWWTLFAFCST